MTAKEAIAELEHGILYVNHKTGEAVRMAIEALQRQDPTKPHIEGDGYWSGEIVYDTWICPNCNASYELEMDEFDYCPECGQAIYWEVEEDEEHES